MLVLLPHKLMKERILSCFYRLLGKLSVCLYLVHSPAIRYLHKVVQQKLPQSQLPNNVCYLASDYPKYMESAVHTPKKFSDPHVLLEAYRQRAKR